MNEQSVRKAVSLTLRDQPHFISFLPLVPYCHTISLGYSEIIDI